MTKMTDIHKVKTTDEDGLYAVVKGERFKLCPPPKNGFGKVESTWTNNKPIKTEVTTSYKHQ